MGRVPSTRRCGRTLAALLLAAASAVPADVCQMGAGAARQRDSIRAEALLKECLQRKPGIEAYLLLAGIYQLQQKSDALYALAVEALKRFPEEQRFYLVVATQDGRQARFGNAIQVLEGALRRWPEDPKIKSLLASSYLGRGIELLDAGDSEVAVHPLRRATELAPEDIEARLNFGRALHNTHQRVEAIAVFDALVNQQPPVPLARFHRALTSYSMGEFRLAIDDLNLELRHNAEFAPARLIRGLALMATGAWEAASTDVELAAAAMPDNPRALYARTRILIETGELEKAEATLRKAIELDAEDAASLNMLIRLLMRIGRRDEALALTPKATALSTKARKAKPGEILFEKATRLQR